MALSRTVKKASAKHLKPFDGPRRKWVRQPIIPPAQPCHAIHTSKYLSNALFNLGGLSTSRECQYLAKEHGRPRTEFSPHLELIRSSEVDTQKAPGSTTTSTSATIGQKVAKGSSITLSTDGLVTMSQRSYHDLKDSIKIMEKRLEESEITSRQLFVLYQKRSREGMILGGICLLLTLAIFYAEEIQKLRTATLETWATDREVEGSVIEEKNPRQFHSQLPGLTWQADVESGPATIGTVAGRAAESNRPWTFSRLFWVAND
ncbi:MAG: hypothetical protein LQ343_002210 [Gyalolechia ehrenbergii]|nr:MAG: hypothetical protein LQ343_002210 [Gyalolechia ehrenbergii]